MGGGREGRKRKRERGKGGKGGVGEFRGNIFGFQVAGRTTMMAN